MLGVSIAIIQDHKILLTKRHDFAVWCLPGGHVDAGESLAQAAIREAREEIGLDIRLTHLIGLYSRPAWQHGDYHIASFAGEIIGGTLSPQPDEVIDIGFFPENALPPHAEFLVGHYQRVMDAFAGIGGSLVMTEDAVWPFDHDLSRQALYEQQHLSNLAPQAFYQRHFSEAGHHDDIQGHSLK